MKRDRSKRVARRRRWTCLLGVGIGFLFLASEVFAQGTVVLGRREGFVEFGYQGDQTKSTTHGVTDFLLRQRRFDERVGLRGNLYVVDPSLATLSYGASFGFFQDSLSVTGQQLPQTGRLLGYDLGGDFFPEKDYSSTVFANRADSIESREFIGTTETLNQNRGARVFLKSFFLPSTLSYRQEFSDEMSRFGDSLGRMEYSRNIVEYDGRNHWKSHDVAAHYEFADVQDHIQHAFSYLSNTANFNDRFSFGEDVPKLLTSSLNFMRRGGSLEFSSLNLNEDLRIKHSQSLSTGYHYVLSRFNTGFGGSTTSQTAIASLQHRLYESLRTAVNLTGSLVSFPNGGERIFGARGDTDYQKKLPGHGRLLANLGGLYEINDNHLQGREIPIFQERHTVRIGVPVRLDQLRAIPDSVLISGETGTIFEEGPDYFVRFVGDFTEIDILPSGRIRDGGIILVDYRVSVSPSIMFSTKSAVFRIGPDYGWVNPYFSYERLLQSLLSGAAEAPLENLRARTVGIRFRFGGAKFSGNFLNEYRNQDSNVLPYKSLQFSQFISYTPRRSFTLGLSFDENLFHYRIPERKTASGLGRLSLGWSPWRSVTIDGFVSARIWRDTIAANETFRDAGFRAKWSTGKFTLASTFNATLIKRNGNLSQEFRWIANITRRF